MEGTDEQAICCSWKAGVVTGINLEINLHKFDLVKLIFTAMVWSSRNYQLCCACLSHALRKQHLFPIRYPLGMEN